MKAVKSRVDDWPVTHPVIRAALLEESVCPDCGQNMTGGACLSCHHSFPLSRGLDYPGANPTSIG